MLCPCLGSSRPFETAGHGMPCPYIVGCTRPAVRGRQRPLPSLLSPAGHDPRAEGRVRAGGRRLPHLSRSAAELTGRGGVTAATRPVGVGRRDPASLTLAQNRFRVWVQNVGACRASPPNAPVAHARGVPRSALVEASALSATQFVKRCTNEKWLHPSSGANQPFDRGEIAVDLIGLVVEVNGRADATVVGPDNDVVLGERRPDSRGV